ncbi:hypothetical protein GCM10022380_69980 [Amycolatopsis tucumanensis]|uniref:Uncharacterized protein n=1 Tax=Amycolatopsis tucumanensis TaxID=401106 RepID=A0ABP7JCX7_9PSEU
MVRALGDVARLDAVVAELGRCWMRRGVDGWVRVLVDAAGMGRPRGPRIGLGVAEGARLVAPVMISALGGAIDAARA